MISDVFKGTVLEAIGKIDGNCGISCRDSKVAKVFIEFLENNGYRTDAKRFSNSELEILFDTDRPTVEFKRSGKEITLGKPIGTDYYIILEWEDNLKRRVVW